MKAPKNLRMLAILCVLTLVSMQAEARLRIPYGSYEKIQKIAELPDSAVYALEPSGYMDLGMKYTVFQILYIPLYQEGESEIVGYGNDETFIALTKEELDGIVAENHLDLGKLDSIPFWDSWGGKLLVVLIIGGIGFYYFFGRNHDNENDEEEPVEPKPV